MESRELVAVMPRRPILTVHLYINLVAIPKSLAVYPTSRTVFRGASGLVTVLRAGNGPRLPDPNMQWVIGRPPGVGR